MAGTPRRIELLSPARDLATGIAAIDHGADAVYIGPPAFGARSSAANSIEDITRLADYAHQFSAKVYATVNTIVYESELAKVEKLIKALYKARVDALIVQDMGILRLDIPPIQLHASTQCDTRTPEKARFLEQVGFSQIVLARELGLDEIADITAALKVPVEVFIHGALCVSYSGRCHAGQVLRSRSANRGECPQICRLPYSLVDADGKVLARNRHLLSLRDFNTSASIPDLLAAGASSFKIEGRLKDPGYVKNVTAYYRTVIDQAIAAEPDKYRRSSCGRSDYKFTPNLYKSFNRGFTDYFLNSRRPAQIASVLTPKSQGEPIDSVSRLNNGDGVAYFDRHGEYQGFRVNRVEAGRIIAAKPIALPKDVQLFRTFDNQWEQLLQRPDSGVRKIAVDVELYPNRVVAADERGNRVVLPLTAEIMPARKPFSPREIFAKTGNTIYTLRNFTSAISPDSYIPASYLTALRRELLVALDSSNLTTYRLPERSPESAEAIYPLDRLDYRDNVANSLAEQFYTSHGVTSIRPALEVPKSGSPRQGSASGKGSVEVMTCRYCLLRELGACKRFKSASPAPTLNFKEPLTLQSGDISLSLHFDCARCEMHISTAER